MFDPVPRASRVAIDHTLVQPFSSCTVSESQSETKMTCLMAASTL